MVKRHRKRVRTKGAAKRLIAAIGPALKGSGSYSARSIRSTFFRHAAYRYFSDWHDISFDKSNGIADRFGNVWKPISEHTKIYRPLSSAERIRFKVGTRKRGLGLLTEKEHKLWKKIFAKTYARQAYWLGEKEAKVIAAKTAWNELKRQGARTKKGTFRGRDARILYVTGRLLDSIKPSSISGSYYRPNKDQIAEFEGSRMTFGTSVPYATNATRGRPLLIPQNSELVRRALAEAMERTIFELVETA